MQRLNDGRMAELEMFKGRMGGSVEELKDKNKVIMAIEKSESAYTYTCIYVYLCIYICM